MHEHESETRRGLINAVCDTIRELQRSGKPILKKVLHETDDEAEALAEERRQIEEHVKRGIALVNWNIKKELLPPFDWDETRRVLKQLHELTDEMLARGIDKLTIRQELRRRVNEAGVLIRLRFGERRKRRRPTKGKQPDAPQPKPAPGLKSLHEQWIDALNRSNEVKGERNER
jgi:hypothetical protein